MKTAQRVPRFAAALSWINAGGRTLLVTGLLMAAPGCTTPSGSPQPGGRHFIGQSEIAATNANTAYDAVQQLRPEFLRGRAVASARSVATELPVVFLDDTRMGDVEQLRNIPASMVLTIQLISAADATTRWGTGYPAGVIEVRTRS